MDKLNEVHQKALKEFEEIKTALQDERRRCLEARRFYSIPGAQWEGKLGEAFDNKPRFEFNKVHLAVMRIISEYRNNPITVTFVNKDGEEGNLADICNGLYRADEQNSVAQEAHSNALEEAVGGGMGAFRLRTEYENDESEDDDKQRIIIEPIFDADQSVYFDLNAKRQDKADAKSCYVVKSMTYDAYEDEFGDNPTSWPRDLVVSEDWLTPDVVYVAEYYKKEEKKETVRVYRLIDGTEKKYYESDFKNDESLEENLNATGAQELRRKKIKVCKIRKYIMSGNKVLEDCGYIAGKNIPIVPVYGKRWYIDNVERCIGHVQMAMDAQRLKNMQLSKLGEISAMSSIRKPIFYAEQMVGHQLQWSDDNIKNYPYMVINPLKDKEGNIIPSGPVGYTEPPEVPQALATLLQYTDQDIQDILGYNNQADKMVSNISGKAVDLIQQSIDKPTFIYISNLAKAMKRSGEIWLSMAKDVYVEYGRKMKIVTVDDATESVTLMKPMVSEEGEEYRENDLSEADFDVYADVGPSSTTKRQAVVRELVGMLQATQDPETQQVLTFMAMMNMEGEGLDETRAYFRNKLIRMGVVKPTKQEAEALMIEMQGQQPDSQTVLMNAMAEEASANAAKSRADTANKIADSEYKHAKTVEVYANIQDGTKKSV